MKNSKNLLEMTTTESLLRNNLTVITTFVTVGQAAAESCFGNELRGMKLTVGMRASLIQSGLRAIFMVCH